MLTTKNVLYRLWKCQRGSTHHLSNSTRQRKMNSALRCAAPKSSSTRCILRFCVDLRSCPVGCLALMWSWDLSDNSARIRSRCRSD